MSRLAYQTQAEARRSQARILVVEDSPVFEKQIQKSVAILGADNKISFCRTGAQAFELLNDPQTEFDLALVDLGLPDIQGVEVIERIRRRFSEMPILVISVTSSESSVMSAIRAGARGYLLKGESDAAIARAIQDVLDGNYPISPALARSLFRLAGAPLARGTPLSFDLSPRELETLQHTARGNNYAEVAQLMGVAVSTVQSHIRSLYRKLDAHTQLQAINKARDAGLI